MFNVAAAGGTPDVERLLLDTVRAAPANSRLFIMAATRMTRFSDCVNRDRLAHLIRNELEEEHRPAMGLLLEWVGTHANGHDSFAEAVSACREGVVHPRADAGPLLDIDRQDPASRRLADCEASALSKKWGRWMADLVPKEGALRPREWVLRTNPNLQSHDRITER